MTTQQATTQTSVPQPPAPGTPGSPEFKANLKRSLQDIQAAVREASQEAGKGVTGGLGGHGVILVPPTPPRADNSNVIPQQAVDIASGFFVMCAVMVIGWPIARALGRRIERKAEVVPANPAIADQLVRIQQAIEAMSIEVERIGESQRFMARLQSSPTPERVQLKADRA